MSDDGDSNPESDRKKKSHSLNDSRSTSTTSSSSPVVTTSRRQRSRRIVEDDSDSDSASSIDFHARKKKIPRVASDVGSDTSSDIIQQARRPARVVSDSDSCSEDIDRGFEGSSSQWETDVSDEEVAKAVSVKVQEIGADSDSSDGQSEKCPICLVSLTTQEVGTPESCDHMFCVECIQEWSKNMNTCPVDRQEYQLILVRKNVDGKIYKQIPVQPPNPQNDVSDIVEDPTYCEICRLSDREDRMLLCDGCDLGYHLECLNPPLNDVPLGEWFCTDCSPEDLVDPEIELYELQLLLDEAGELGRPRNSRRTTSSRLVPRTRHSERVRRRIVNNRHNQTVNNPAPDPLNNDNLQMVSSTTSRRIRKQKRRKRRKPRYKVVYKIDPTTGETVAVKKRMKMRKRRKRLKQRPLETPKTVKKRLALQLGICAPRNVPQNLPDVRVQPQVTNLQTQRFRAGIPDLDLFGSRDEFDYFSESEGEVDSSGILVRRAPNSRDVVTFRRARVKAINLSNSVSSTTDILSSILDSQSKFHSRNTRFSLGEGGEFRMEKSDNRVELGNYRQFLRQRPMAYSDNATNNNAPSSSGTRHDCQNNQNSPDRSTAVASSTVEANSVTNASMGSHPEEYGSPQDYTQTNLYTIYDVNQEDKSKDKAKKSEDVSEDNTPRSGTPASESEIDIYSDIETVSTSKADENDMKAPSPVPLVHTPNAGTDDDNNDSEPDMVIDTDKANLESEENGKEETTVTSTVDSNMETEPTSQPIVSSSEIQSQAVQSSCQLFDDKSGVDKEHEDDEDSEDECPNFSIYSKESITMAKNTDVLLTSCEVTEQQNNQDGEVSSSPAVNDEGEVNMTSTGVNDDERHLEKQSQSAVKKKISTGLYSDSEDESVVKRGVESSFGISDLCNLTEDISEEERSYTPCLDERAPGFREGLEGLDTEMISDEDRNDFDESHELKTASDGDALEINAKESELDFTRPEDYEEGEIVDKSKNKKAEEVKKSKEESKKQTKKDDNDKSANKENESVNTNKDSTFKKLSKNNKERNYRDKDKERSKSRDKKDKESKKDGKKEKRKEIKRYDVRALIAEKPRRLKDKFGRDVRRTPSRSRTRTPSPRRSLSRPRRSPSNTRRSPSKPRRSLSKTRCSVSKHRSLSKERSRKKKRRSRNRRSLSRSKSRSVERRRSRSKIKKRRRSRSRDRRKKSRDRSKGRTKKYRSRSRHRSRSISPRRTKEWSRRHSRDWTPSLSRSRTPEARHQTPSWTPPRMIDSAVKPHNLTVILTNDANKKKKDKKRKMDKKSKENERAKKRKRNDRTPPPSKEVFASGDNILVSVSFNKDNEVRDVSTKKRRDAEEAGKKTKKDKGRKRKRNRDLSGIKPVAIIDLDRSPFKEITPSPKDVIVLSDSDNEEPRGMQKAICDSSQQVASPERIVNSYTTGPKTPPEPQVKFTLASKQTQMRAIINPLHEPEEIEPEGDTQEVTDAIHKGPNTPPEPPNSPPSSPDAYDPFEPTKSRSPTPEPMQIAQSSAALNLDDNREDSIMEVRTGILELEKTNNSITQTPDVLKSHTPPLADVQPADSQSSIQATPESNLGKSPERSASASVQTQTIPASKPVAQTIPFSSVPASIITSTPVNSTLAPPRINILNSTIITPPHVASSIPQRIVLPNTIKSSPVKISPTKSAIKSTPIKPMPSKTPASKGGRKSNSRNQNGSDAAEANLGLDSPYSPGSSDYEDLFEPPVETAPKPTIKPINKNAKSPNKVQNAFDALFGTSPFNKLKPKQDNKTKFNKKPQPISGKGTKQVGVKLDEDNLKILDELPNSAVEMQVKDKFLKKLNRQERVVEEVKLVLKPHYNKKHVNKEEYKDILRRSVPKICHNKSGEINPTKIKNLIEAYVKKVRHSKKVTSSSNSINPQKA